MIIIFYGHDTYRSREKLRAFIEECRNKNGPDLAIHRIDAEEEGSRVLKDLYDGQSLFSRKKIVVVENFLSDPVFFEKLSLLFKQSEADRDCILVLWERELTKDQKKKCTKLFNLAKVEEYMPLQGVALEKFIQEEAKKRTIVLTAKDTEYIKTASDSWGIINKLEQVLLEKKIASEMKQGSSIPLSIYALGDTFFSYRDKDALSTLLHLFYQGEEEFSMFSYLASHMRTLITVKSYVDSRVPVPSSLGIHPYVIKKASVIARNISMDTLLESHTKFFEEDVGIKTGLSRPKDSLLLILMARSMQNKNSPV